MKFIDEVTIIVKSGKGGPGCTSFRREAGTPRGGPDGGDGGRGGDVIFRVSPHINSLIDFRQNKTYAAGNGVPGQSMKMTGPDGADLILEVPAGTVLTEVEGGEQLADLEQGDLILLRGGRGGKGNCFFKTSVTQAPEHSQPGEAGEVLKLKLELKLIADVGIIGYPNAGKSTLISHISAAHPKVADYPFTTLTPNLGVVRMGEDRTYVAADIPGLIPGAHRGVGLGVQFLRHIERTKVFVHLIDVGGFSGRDPLQDYHDINFEMKAYDELHEKSKLGKPLSLRPQVIALNKADILSEEQREETLRQFLNLGHPVVLCSAATGYNLKDLIYKVGRVVFGDD
jgi:GTP-binding protein